MIKKIYNICFISLFMCIIATPLIFTDWSSGGVSLDENRNLAELPQLIVEGDYNENFTKEYETWFMDHLGLRKWLIDCNASMQFNVFDRLLDKSNYYLGPDGDLNYATDEMIVDYAHLNLRSEEEVRRIGDSYQIVSDYLEGKGIEFYYVQCYDKHSIYPEQFMTSVNQIGDISKTDQVITNLRENTTVNTISLKEVLLDSKAEYEVYSNWGDPTHWSERGARIGYRYIMESINSHNDNKYKVLKDSDYDIDIIDQGITLNGSIHREDMLEAFSIKEPQAQRENTSNLGGYFNDARNGIWVNENAGNDTTLLLLCDSYIGEYLVEDFAESFGKVILIWADYGEHLTHIVATYNPDIVVFECAERVDRSHIIELVAGKINKSNN